LNLKYWFLRSAILFLFLNIFFAQGVFADGTVTIKGTIYDATTETALPGANIEVKGTGIGAATDLDGVFIMRNVPSGKQTLIVTYIGYQTETREVDLPASGSVREHFKLNASSVEGEEVVVTAQAQGQLAAINQQLTSDKIANMVSEARIQELPDFNAAQALSRLPGVSTTQSSGEANKVVIRGLAPKYNSVEVEGIKLSSTGSTQIGVSSQPDVYSRFVENDRSVDLSMVSPYMIKTISVYKSLTPDMNADAIGGTVNMELREAPSRLHADLLYQSGYTAKSSTYGNYRGVGSVSRRFFDDKLGVYFLGNLEKYDRDADNMDAQYGIVSSQLDSGETYLPVRVNNVGLVRHIETRKRFGGNLVLDYRLPSGSIKSINLFTRLKSNYQDYTTKYNYNSRVLDFNYRGGDNTIDLTVNSLDFDYDLGFMLIKLQGAYTTALNNLPKEPRLTFRQTGGTGGAVPENVIPDSLKNRVQWNGDTSMYLTNITLFSTKYKEDNQSYKADLKFPFSFGPSFISGYLKIGGQYRHSKHINDQSTPYIGLRTGNSFTDSLMQDLVNRFGIPYDSAVGKFPASSFRGDPELTKTFLDNQFGSFYWAPDPTIPIRYADYLNSAPQWSGRAFATETGGWYNGLYQTLANDYHYVERYYAGYVMAELKYSKFMAVGGVRYEKQTGAYTAYNMIDARNPLVQTYFEATAHPENEYWLPMAQVRYNALRWFDVRYAYTQTLARPDYQQLSPKFSMDYAHENVWAGNPDLKPAHAFNHDLVFSFHSNKLGLFSIGGFYKTIKDFTFYTEYRLHPTASPGLDSLGSFNPRPRDNARIYTYQNTPYDSYVKGIELDFQSRFWYMPFPVNGVVFGANFTYCESDATYPWRDNKQIPNPNFPPPPRFLVFTLDSTRSGRLLYQPKRIVNGYIGYEYKGFSGRVSVVFQENSVNNVGAFPEQDGFTKDYFRVDASARQQLPWPGLEVYLDLFNLNNEEYSSAQRSIGGFNRVENYGLTANLGLRFRL
jgi:TonB-dependent receptor